MTKSERSARAKRKPTTRQSEQPLEWETPMYRLAVAQLDRTAEQMGLASSRLLGTLFDGIARHTQEGLDFVAREQHVGFRQAVRERDDPFGDYGSRKR